MTVDFEECIKDSPRFRAGVDDVETEVVEIEAKLDKLVKLCSGMIDAGRAYVTANKLLVNGIKDLGTQCKKEEMISILFDQAQRSIKQQIHTFIKEDVRKFKDTKKQFDRVRDDMELAQVKNAQAPKNKPHEAEEASQVILCTTCTLCTKKFEILDAVRAFNIQTFLSN
uniref:Arf-GAP with coiled-coil, ANK repeat and PH domain-containing protein n=1 Tax=Periophthalmus magnuspinnatus TaxID=409849 RepID=A0A3B4A550_9GOBI